jgi:glycosyltransferase involved in cell wall biosynthesis
VDDIALLSAADADFDAALVEAMAAGKPVIVGDAGEALPIRHRANGLHVNGDPAAALRDLLADPLLARQFAVAARHTYEREGLRDLGIVTEAVAIYRAAAPEAVAHAGG